MNIYLILPLCSLLISPCFLCSIPNNPVHGYWFCINSVKRCYLECDPGYVSSGRTSLSCMGQSWIPDPYSIECSDAFALITGGLVGGYQPLRSVEIYGPGVHIELPELPSARVDHSVDNFDGTIILCGNLNSDSKSCIRMTGAFGWENHSNTWNLREEHVSVVMQDRLYLIGGSTSHRTSEFLEDSPDNIDWTVGEELDIAREQSCVVKISPEIFVIIGGYTAMNKVSSWNVTSGVRERLADTLEVRVDHACALLKDQETGLHGILVAGGSLISNNGTVQGGHKTSEFYSFSTGTWREVGQLNQKRSDLGQRMLVFKTGVYLFGGSTYNLEVERQVEVFNLKTETWNYAEPMIWSRRDYALTVVPQSWFI